MIISDVGFKFWVFIRVLPVKFNSFGAIVDYSRPSGRPLLSTLVDITSYNGIIKTASNGVSVNQYRDNSTSVESIKTLVVV